MTTTNGPLGSKHRAWSALALAVSLTGAGAVARADALSDLREQTEALQRKVNELEDAQKKTAPASVVTGGAVPGSFTLPGSNTSIKLGGHVKFGAAYSDTTPRLDTLTNPRTLANRTPAGAPGA